MKEFTHYIHRFSVLGKRIQDATSEILHSSAALFVPSKWTHDTIHALLNEEDTQHRESLTSNFVSSTLNTMNTISLTVHLLPTDPFAICALATDHRQSALVAGVISGAFSWYNVEQTHWCTRATWYSGLIFALASISASGLCSGSLLRLKCHPDSTSRVRTVLGYPSRHSHEWTPRALQSWIWGVPGLLLKLSVLWFLVGLGLEIWLSARRARFDWESDDVKVRFGSKTQTQFI